MAHEIPNFSKEDAKGMASKISIDTNILLNVKNREEPFYKHSRQLLDRIDEGRVKCVLSTVVIAEMCSGYYEFDQLEEKDDFINHIRSSSNYGVVDLDIGIADEAGRLRRSTGLRLVDTIIVASALRGGASILVTHDDEFQRASSVIKVLTAEKAIRELMQ